MNPHKEILLYRRRRSILHSLSRRSHEKITKRHSSCFHADCSQSWLSFSYFSRVYNLCIPRQRLYGNNVKKLEQMFPLLSTIASKINVIERLLFHSKEGRTSSCLLKLLKRRCFCCLVFRSLISCLLQCLDGFETTVSAVVSLQCFLFAS